MTGKSSYLFLLIILLILVACEESDGGLQGGTKSVYQVDPLFREYHDQLGGDRLIGATISPGFSRDRFIFQYTISGLMVFDGQAEESERFSLAPIGNDMNIEQPVSGDDNPAKSSDQTGFENFSEFQKMYTKLGSEKSIGIALTPPRFSHPKQRYEQFFTNLGFYRSVNDAPGTVKLLAYGAWKCGDSCMTPPIDENEVILPEIIGERFSPWVSELKPEFTGFAISPVKKLPDGTLQQVFENLVLEIRPGEKEIRILPLTRELGILPEPLQLNKNIPGMIFIPVQSGMGYHVLETFNDYLEAHGGLTVSGLPIGELQSVGNKLRRQCFENLCIEEDGRVGQPLNIRLSPLGYSFTWLNTIPTQAPIPSDIPKTESPEGEDTVPEWQSDAELSLQVWELYPFVGPQQNQEIFVSVFLNGTPVGGVLPTLTLNVPGAEQIQKNMQPTSSDGQSHLGLDAIDAPNGTIITYQVCVPISGDKLFCGRGDFIIWATP
jgi:hypothetical protein